MVWFFYRSYLYKFIVICKHYNNGKYKTQLSMILSNRSASAFLCLHIHSHRYPSNIERCVPCCFLFRILAFFHEFSMFWVCAPFEELVDLQVLISQRLDAAVPSSKTFVQYFFVQILWDICTVLFYKKIFLYKQVLYK